MVEGVAFVREQRRDAYYRNDPSKYGLGFERNFRKAFITTTRLHMWDSPSAHASHLANPNTALRFTKSVSAKSQTGGKNDLIKKFSK